MTQWFKATEKKTGKVFYVANGFGQDGLTVAIVDPATPCSTGIRLRPEECRERYTLGQKLDADKNKAFASRFTYELHR